MFLPAPLSIVISWNDKVKLFHHSFTGIMEISTHWISCCSVPGCDSPLRVPTDQVSKSVPLKLCTMSSCKSVLLNLINSSYYVYCLLFGSIDQKKEKLSATCWSWGQTWPQWAGETHSSASNPFKRHYFSCQTLFSVLWRLKTSY